MLTTYFKATLVSISWIVLLSFPDVSMAQTSMKIDRSFIFSPQGKPASIGASNESYQIGWSAHKVIRIGDIVGVCARVMNLPAQGRKKFIRFSTVTAANGKRIKRNLTGISSNTPRRPTKPLRSASARDAFLIQLSDPRQMLGQKAACISTKTKWRDEYAQGSKLKVPNLISVRR